jgi:hypothetical protein
LLSKWDDLPSEVGRDCGGIAFIIVILARGGALVRVSPEIEQDQLDIAMPRDDSGDAHRRPDQ